MVSSAATGGHSNRLAQEESPYLLQHAGGNRPSGLLTITVALPPPPPPVQLPLAARLLLATAPAFPGS
jgi:hypothetical protein